MVTNLPCYRHSSSSAIFERDIESVPAFQLNPTSPKSTLSKISDPHRTSRGSAHEPLESSVPSVLSSAASALALSLSPTSEDAAVISVIVPASITTATASPPSSFALLGNSRSPSPTGTQFSFSQSPTQTSRLPLPERENSGPYPPGAFPPSSSSGSPPPLSPPLPSPRPKRSTQSLATTISPEDRSPSPPNNRLSFISYHVRTLFYITFR